MEIERETLVPANGKAGETAVAILNLVTCCRVPVTSSSVFDGLSKSKFSRCHLVTASAHTDSLLMSADDEESTEMYSCVSQANWWYCRWRLVDRLVL